jgi:hypothetical protein
MKFYASCKKKIIKQLREIRLHIITCSVSEEHLMGPSMSLCRVFHSHGTGGIIVGTNCCPTVGSTDSHFCATMIWNHISGRMTEEATVTWDDISSRMTKDVTMASDHDRATMT